MALAYHNPITNRFRPALTKRNARLNGQPHDPNSLLKKGIWLYFLLLLFEGSLRKWFLPSLSMPLLVIRDPIALWLVITASRRQILPKNFFLTLMIVVGIAALFAAVFVGHGSLPVAIYGARILLFHFPMMFVMAAVLTREDIIKFGKVTIWIALPMTILIGLQFYSPQSAWVNRGIGGDMKGAGFGGVMGYFRPPGTFSFTTGTHLFYGFLGCFLLYFWIRPGLINKLLLATASVCLIAAIPLSISRSLFFQVGVSGVFAMVGIFRNPKYIGQVMFSAVLVIFGMFLISDTDFFKTATEAFTERFETANENEGGLKGVLADRFLGGMISALAASMDQPIFGHGIGKGSNVGAMLLSGDRIFLLSEQEWGKTIEELGAIMGLSVIFARVGICVQMFRNAYKKLVAGDLLPWMLGSFAYVTITQSTWSQPTALGFSTMIGGLLLASLRNKPKRTLQNPRFR